ncbi:MAG: phosphoketolase family protein, partial [Firmicutes bacterium]|nr:phosphoketolase family protein [Bacillota bacterium]
IANPTLLARIPEEELLDLFRGYGYTPYVVAGEDPAVMHQQMAATLDTCLDTIRDIQRRARTGDSGKRPRWPMIILRTPKGWTAPRTVDGHYVEGYWRAHQVPIPDVTTNPEHLRLLEDWLRSYRPQELFEPSGRPAAFLRALAPTGPRRMSANPHANGGLLRKPLRLPDFRAYAVAVPHPGAVEAENTAVLGTYLRDVIRRNPRNFRLFGPDETASNRLQAVYEATGKAWMAENRPEDQDEGHLSPDGRVMEMLSEHTLEGWLEGYLLTGRHGLLNSYEAFVHIIDSMVNQHAKWIEKARQEVTWRAPIASLNILISSTVWRQDHNGFTHQDPGFLDVVTNKQAGVVRIYLPPDANCLLSVADHCLASTDYVNVIVADKQPHLQYLDMDSAATHCAKGIGLWDWAGTDADAEPEVVMAAAGDVATMEALAATALLRQHFPDLRLRFVNVVDLFKLQPPSQHPHGLPDRDYDSLFPPGVPVVFNFHGYPALVHKLTYRRAHHDRLHVHGYREAGSINTPLQLAILNGIDRFHLAIDAIDQVPRLGSRGTHVKEWLKDEILRHLAYACEHGIDPPEIRNWRWPQDL